MGLGLKFAQIYSTDNFAIVIESGAIYANGYYGVDGYKILLCEDILSGLSVGEINECIEGAIWSDMTIAKGMRDASRFAGDTYWWGV